MRYSFGDYVLDPDRFELLGTGAVVHVEPQVLQLLLYLVENRHRMVSKDEIVEAIWDGRAVSDAAISSRIHMARNAVGDSGGRQRAIRTVHGRGFRFVAEVTVESPEPPVTAPERAVPAAPASPADASAGDEASALPPILAGRPSIAVLPLSALGLPPERALMADAVSHDLIQALSRLRWLAVTARASTFLIRETMPDAREIGAKLRVRYVLSGMLDLSADRLSATLELAETADGGVIWADRLTVAADAVDELRTRIVAEVVEALEIYVPLNEAMLARLGGSDRLDAWASYHLGLHHMYRFTQEDNTKATGHFERALQLDPRFARAHGGLSFTRFQDAFMRYADDPGTAAKAARAHAERGLELDPLDPFVNLNMGRSYWLTAEPEAAAGWLDRATQLNPNYAQGFYSRAFTANLVGDEPTVSHSVEAAMRLSPLDPLLYGMLAAKAMTLVQTGQAPEGADWAERAANSPGAHFIIWMIAVACHGAAGRDADAARWAGRVRAIRPDASQQHFFAALPLRNPAAREIFGAALAAQGF